RVAGAVPALVAVPYDRANIGEPLDRLEDPLTERRVLLDDQALVGGEGSGLGQDLRGDPDLADVVEQGSKLKPLQGLLVELEPAAEAEGEVSDRPGVGRGVRVIRLERIRERLDRRDEGSLQALGLVAD